MTMKPIEVNRVERALEAFNKMAPGLSTYASAYVGKRVRVEAGSVTQTDGKTIFIRPPLSLAKSRKHRVTLCGLRGADGYQRCKACAIRETVITMLHHEIAHISHGSFVRYAPYEMRGILYDTVQKYLPMYTSTFYDVVNNRTDPDGKLTSLAIAGKVHGHISMVHLSCEDHRINTESYIQEPQLYKRMHQLSKDVFENGIEQDDNTFVKWQDQELDKQIMIAPLFYMEGFDIQDQFDQSVVDAVYDIEAKTILDNIANGTSSLYNLSDSMILLSIWRRHGFLTKNTEPEDQMNSEQKKEYDEALDALREILKALFGHTEKLGLHGDEVGLEGAEIGSGPGDVDDQTMNRVITAKKYLDNVPGHMAGMNVFQPDKGPCRNGDPSYVEKAGEGIIGNAVAKARIAFGVNARAKTHRDQKSGRVDARNLGKRAWNEGDSRLFKQKTVPDKRDYEVLIGFDCSGSTSSSPDYNGGPSRLDMLKFSVCALADTMNRLGVKFSIYAHNTGGRVYQDNGTVDRGSSMDIYIMKSVSEVWSPQVRERVANHGPGGSNLDGNTLQFYRKQLDKSRATDKILMYFTDGIMPGMATAHEVPILKSEIQECRKRGYTLLGVGVFTDAPKQHGLPTVQVDGPEDYPNVITHLAKRLMN